MTVKGRVVDAAGKPLARASLHTISELYPYATRATESADDGSFEFAPMMPGIFTLCIWPPFHPEGTARAGVAHAVFLNQGFEVPDADEPVNLTVQAQPHVNLEFQWIDRRTEKGSLVNDGHFTITGRARMPDGQRVLWEGSTAPALRGDKQVLQLIVPAALTEATLRLPIGDGISLSYESEGYQRGAGDVPLSGVMNHRRRIIYVDDSN